MPFKVTVFLKQHKTSQNFLLKYSKYVFLRQAQSEQIYRTPTYLLSRKHYWKQWGIFVVSWFHQPLPARCGPGHGTAQLCRDFLRERTALGSHKGKSLEQSQKSHQYNEQIFKPQRNPKELWFQAFSCHYSAPAPGLDPSVPTDACSPWCCSLLPFSHYNQEPGLCWKQPAGTVCAWE